MLFYVYLFILIPICYLVSTVIHELGHAYFVRYTNNNLIEVSLGKGKRGIYLFKIGSLEVKKFFFLYGSRCVWGFNSWDNFRRDGIMISSGGCIANSLLFMISLTTYFVMSKLNYQVVTHLFLVLTCMSSFQMFINLLPIRGFDGYKIILYSKSSKSTLMREQVKFSSNYEL